MAGLLPVEGLDAQVVPNRGTMAVESPFAVVRQRHVWSKLQAAAQMINDNGGDFFQCWKVMKSLEALQQGQKTERVLISSGVGLRELSLRIRRRERLSEFAGCGEGAESRIRGALD